MKEGQRVEIPVHLDLWMQGARFGTVTKVNEGIIHIRMDHPQVKRLVKLPLTEMEQWGKVLK